jgi:uncharacterized membrane protein
VVLNPNPPGAKGGLLHALGNEWPKYFSFVLSFFVIGVIWAQHHQMFRNFRRSDHLFFIINVLFLMWVAFIPFRTSVLATYLGTGQEGTAMAFYAATFVVGSLLFNLLWRYAIYGDRLLDEHADRKAIGAITRSYNPGVPLYLVDFGLAFVSPKASLVFFVLLALFYAVAPLMTKK